MKVPETDFLLDFFKELNNRNIRYAVLRNSDTLPESLGGSDLDILAYDSNEVELIKVAASDVAKRYGGGCTVQYRVEATISCWGGRNEDGSWWGVHIDMIPGVLYHGIPYMDSEALYEERKLVKGVFYRCGPLANIGSFMKEITRNHKTRKDYYPMARISYAKYPDRCEKAMIGLIGSRGWNIVETLLKEEQPADVITNLSKRFTRLLYMRMICKMRFVRLAKIRLNNIVMRYRRFFRYPGYCVAFLGTDGSGKSTLIEKVKPTLYQMMHHPVEYRHLRPGLLPSLARLAGRPAMEGPVTNPHGGTTAGWISSLIRFSYYYIDYTLGYFVKIFPWLVKRPTLVICDRYYYEYMIDPKRCAVKLPPGWARFWGWFIPKPDLILCLGGDPEKIYARKPETSLEEVRRQVVALKKFCDGNRRAVWIDTTKSIEESYDAAMSAIEERMRKRYSR